MSNLPRPSIERELRQAHLLCVREQFDEAKRLLLELKRRDPHNRDVDHLLARVSATEQVEKAEEDHRRRLRYTFGLQTTASRLWWGFVSIVAAAYGVVGECLRLPDVWRHGLGWNITTLVSKGGRYSRYRMEPWTRPIYVDLIYYGVFALAGVVALCFIIKVSKGSAQWEELDATSSSASNW